MIVHLYRNTYLREHFAATSVLLLVKAKNRTFGDPDQVPSFEYIRIIISNFRKCSKFGESCDSCCVVLCNLVLILN
jgi:hypothetical protein